MYTVFIRNNETGEVRTNSYDFEWNLYWWADGNFSCDCNREWEFLRAGGEKITDDPLCGDTRFSVTHAIVGNLVFAIDSDDEPELCPSCGDRTVLPNGYSGVKCMNEKCDYWFCY